MKPVTAVSDLMDLVHGYQRSMVLFTAVRLGVFDALAAGEAGARALGARMGADPVPLAILLDALAAQGLLEKEAGRYRNGGLASSFLVAGPGSKAFIIRHHADCWAGWSRLERRIRAGRIGPHPFRPGGYQENFIRGMDDNARERAVAVAAAFPLRAGCRLLDLGGGPGTYALAWAKRHPGALVTLFDTRPTLRVTRRILAEKGASRLIRLVGGDFLGDPIGGPYDFVWISQILHAFPPKECVALLRKARRSLAPGGRVAVQEFLLDEGKTSPPGPALFSVHMTAVTEAGRAYTSGEVAAMLRRAGLRRVERGGTDAAGVGILSARVGK